MFEKKNDAIKEYRIHASAEYVFEISNIIISIFVGVVIYLLFRMCADEIYSYVSSAFIEKLIRIIRFYVPDILWAYALFLAVSIFCDNSRAGRCQALFISALFAGVMELIQVLPDIGGTYDFMDMVVEWCSQIVALLVIKMYRGEKKHEKKELGGKNE